MSFYVFVCLFLISRRGVYVWIRVFFGARIPCQRLDTGVVALADGYTGVGVGGRMNQENDGSKDGKKKGERRIDDQKMRVER